MLKKTLITVLVVLVLLVAVPATSMAAPGKISPYKGMVGADSPLYGLKLLIEDLDESLAGSNTAKLQKQMDHAQKRLSEAMAAAEADNPAAMEAALNEYNSEINDINSTMEQEDVSEEQYSEVGPVVDEQQQALEGMIDTGSIPGDLRDSLAGAYNNSTKIKNGRPFIYYNNTTYFVPPGHLKNGVNSTFVPPGLAKKGYVAPQPIIVNGSPTWPFPTNLTEKAKDKNKNKGYQNLTDLNTSDTDKNKDKGNGKNNGNGNGNGNGKGNGNGNNKN